MLFLIFFILKKPLNFSTICDPFTFSEEEFKRRRLTRTALRMDPMMNRRAGVLSIGSSCVSPPFSLTSFTPFSSEGLKGQVSSMSPSSRAIFSPLKLGFSYRTHLKGEELRSPTGGSSQLMELINRKNLLSAPFEI